MIGKETMNDTDTMSVTTHSVIAESLNTSFTTNDESISRPANASNKAG